MLYSKFKENLFKGASFDLANDTIKVALLTQAYSVNAAHEFFSDISAHEVAGTGYAAGGSALANKSVTNVDGLITLDADDIEWTITGQISALYAVIYKDTGDPATSRLISLKQFLTIRSVINETYTLEWGAKGVFQVK